MMVPLPMADDKEKFAQQICQLIPINELTSQAQNEVLNKATLVKVRKGGTIFKQGDRDDYSFYLIEGEVEFQVDNRAHSTLAAGADRARYAMAQLQPRQFSAKATKPATVMQITRDYLDKLMVLHEKDQPDKTNYDLSTAEVQVEELSADDDVDWMTRMLQSELFSRMPTANIHALFALLEAVEYKTGEQVIQQGDPGDHYYIIQEGRCQVLRAPTAGGKEIKLAELKAGDSFGEEALITNTSRNASVSMLTPGTLMRLSKDNFVELIKKPTLQRVTLAKAREMVKAGAVWLDVRFKNEYDQSAVEGSLNIPLNVLRMQADKLDRAKEYIVCCDTGGRSSTGAFLLAERGFKVSYLDGGLVNNSGAAKDKAAAGTGPAPTVAPAPAAPSAPSPAAKAPPSPPKPAPAAKPAAAPPKATSAADADPDVTGSFLETELARTDMRIKNVENRKQNSSTQEQRDEQAEIERKLREERAKIEQAKKEAEEEAKRLRQVEEEKLKHMKSEAEKRLQEEKKKLEEVYSRNAEEMEKLQRMKQEAEEQMRKDRERLEKEAAEAKKQLEEAQQLKKQIEASRKAMEKEGQKRLKEQEEMERRIQEKAREKLEIERKKLAEQFAHNNEQLEEAKRERVAADASRQAARDEADKIIAEYKAKHDEARAVEESRLKAERQKVEEEQKKIQESLRDIERARKDAETARRSAVEEVERLRARKSDADVTQNKRERESLQQELHSAEERLAHAKKEIDAAQEAQEEAEQARKINEEDLAQRKVLEEELRSRLEEDLQDFKEELAQQEKQFKSIGSQMEHMRRIREKANSARQAAQQANDNLLSDVASQLDTPPGK